MKQVVIIGGGIIGAGTAYFLSVLTNEPLSIVIIEANEIAAHASGKAGGFIAKDWGNAKTNQLHESSFILHEEIAKKLNIKSYRRVNVSSVEPGSAKSINSIHKNNGICWLDGNIKSVNSIGTVATAAQVCPYELTTRFSEASGCTVMIGTAVGVNLENATVTSVKYQTKDNRIESVRCDLVLIAMGPWSCIIEDWFQGISSLTLPMEGIHSSSLIYGPGLVKPEDGHALFCSDHPVYDTHLEVYPRVSGEVYVCGLGGSDHVQSHDLKANAWLYDCPPNPDCVNIAIDALNDLSSAFVKKQPIKTQACMRPVLSDGLPVMGKIPELANVFLSSGHNCWGICWAPICSKSIAQLMLNIEPCINLSFYSPCRFQNLL